MNAPFLLTSPDMSLWGLFVSSFLGATLLPGGSEFVLIGVLKLHPDLFGQALLVATLGNTLGGMVSFYTGRLLPRTASLKHLAPVQRYGVVTLLLAWLPLVGDALCVAAGWLRLNPWYAALFIALGKCARYGVIGLAV